MLILIYGGEKIMKNFSRIALFFYLVIFFIVSCGKSPSQKATDLMELGMHQEAIQLLTSEISKNPKNGELHYTLGLVYIDIEKERSASETFERAIKINDKYKKLIADEYWNKAFKKLEERDSYNAEELFHNAIKYDSSLVKKVSVEIYKKGSEYLKNSEKSHICWDFFRLALGFWGDKKKDDRFIEMSAFVNEYSSILEIDSLNTIALAGLTEEYWTRNLYDKSIQHLKSLRKLKPLGKEWHSVNLDLKNASNNVGTIIARSKGTKMIPINSNGNEKPIPPFGIVKYDEKSDNKYIIDFSGNIYETKTGWLTWGTTQKKFSNIDTFSDPNKVVGEYLDYAMDEGFLFEKLPTVVSIKDKEETYYVHEKGLNYNVIPFPGDKIRKGSIKLTGRQSSFDFLGYRGGEYSIHFKEVTFECYPKFVVSKFTINPENVILGCGTIEIDRKRINAVKHLSFYTPTQQENILDNKITKGYTRFELEIALGEKSNSLSELSRNFKNGGWEITLNCEKMTFVFKNGLLESWRAK